MTRSLPRRRRTAWWLTASVLPLVLGGCNATEPTGRDAELTQDQFVDVIVALREAEYEVVQEAPADSLQLRFIQRRDEILAAHGVTADHLREFVGRHQERPSVMAAIWERIAERLGPTPSDSTERHLPTDEIW
jgi:hypothetical protein